MESYLIYIGKSALAAGAFYIAYLVLFQNQKHFVFNRFYLPVSLALSFVIPLITFTTVKFVETTPSSNLNSFAYLANTISGVSLPEFALQWYHYLIGLYILGAAGFLFHLLLGHLKAMNIIRFSRLKMLFGTEVNVTPKDVHPFSFFNKIVISENTLDSTNLQIIVNHENIHVKEKHTLDILFVELLFIAQWFNPFAWLIKDAVKNNLEYKTDHQITKINNPKDYQLAMVALADKQGVAPFLTALNGSQLKNRIVMMKKKTENKYAFLKQLIVLPLLAILVMGLANREIRTEFIETEKKVEIILDGEIISINNKDLASVDFSKGVNSRDVIEALEIDDVLATTIDVVGEKLVLFIRTSDYVTGTNKEFERLTTKNIVLDGNKLTEEYFYAIDNKIVDKKEFEEKGEIGFKNVIFLSGEDATNKYGKEFNGVIADATSGIANFVITKNLNKLRSSESENANVRIGDEIIFPDPRTEEFTEYMNSINEDGEIVIDPLVENFPYVLLDGELVSNKVVISENDVVSISATQPPWSENLHGENYKYGFIHIKTKSKQTNEYKVTGKIINQNGDPISGASILIKGKQIGTISDSEGNYEIRLDEENETLIFTMVGFEKQEIKVEDKTEINIKLKADKNAKPNESKVQYYGTQINPTVGDSHVKASKTLFLDSIKNEILPIYIVDGKEIEDINTIKVDDIESISVLKNKSATALYGEKGKNGVILISTKNALSKSISYDSKIYEGKFGDMSVSNYAVSHTVDEKRELRFNVEEMPQFPGGELALRKYIENSVRYPETAKENGIKGKVYVTFIINKNGEVTDSRISRGVAPILDKEAQRVVNSLPLWKPGKQGGKPVDVSYTVPVLFEVQDKIQVNKKPKITYLPNKNSSSSAMLTGSYNNDSVLYVVDGKEIDGESLSKIQPETIESISIIKDSSAVDIYGEKAKNGVIIITLKDGKKKAEITKITNQLELRNFIAQKIKYPPKSQNIGTEGKVQLFIKVDENGGIYQTTGEPSVGDLILDEVVVVAYVDINAETTINDNSEMLVEEVVRVVNLLPVIEIQEYKGKTVKITVKFILQK